MSSKKLSQLLKLNKPSEEVKESQISNTKPQSGQSQKNNKGRDIDRVRKNIEKKKQQTVRTNKLNEMYDNRAKVKKSVVDRISSLL